MMLLVALAALDLVAIRTLFTREPYHAIASRPSSTRCPSR
jgi:hypothetical protein